MQIVTHRTLPLFSTIIIISIVPGERQIPPPPVARDSSLLDPPLPPPINSSSTWIQQECKPASAEGLPNSDSLLRPPAYCSGIDRASDVALYHTFQPPKFPAHRTIAWSISSHRTEQTVLLQIFQAILQALESSPAQNHFLTFSQTV